MYNKLLLLSLLSVLTLDASAQTFDFDMTKPQPVYTSDNGAGYDIIAAPDVKRPAEPFYFSVKVPDGNYKVRVVLGSNDRSC